MPLIARPCGHFLIRTSVLLSPDGGVTDRKQGSVARRSPGPQCEQRQIRGCGVYVSQLLSGPALLLPRVADSSSLT